MRTSELKGIFHISNQILSFGPSIVVDSTNYDDCGPQVIEIVGDGLRKIFLVWNRAYRTICVVAVDTHEALHLAVACKHIKRAGYYRRFEDVTEKALAGQEIDALGAIEDVERLLNIGRSGVLQRNSEGSFTIGGCSTSESSADS